jgi:hypothetical protein
MGTTRINTIAYRKLYEAHNQVDEATNLLIDDALKEGRNLATTSDVSVLEYNFMMTYTVKLQRRMNLLKIQ